METIARDLDALESTYPGITTDARYNESVHYYCRGMAGRRGFCLGPADKKSLLWQLLTARKTVK